MPDQTSPVDAIVRRPYTRMLVPNVEGNWTVEVLEFPGCIAEGATPADAVAASDAVLRDVVEIMVEDGDLLPEPAVERELSGVTTVRMLPSLHRRASVLAHLEGTSLNRLIQTAVAEYIGHVQTSSGPPSTDESSGG